MADSGVTIEKLQVEVEASASKAQQSIRSLTSSLENLKQKCSGGCGLSAVVDELNRLNQAASGATAGASGIQQMAAALKSLKGLGKLSLPDQLASQISSIGTAAATLGGSSITSLTSLGQALNGMGKISFSVPANLPSQITQLSNAVTQAGAVDLTKFLQFTQVFENLSGVKVSSKLNTEIGKLAETAQRIKDMDFSSFTELNNHLAPLVSTLTQINSTAPQTANVINNLGNQVERSNAQVEQGTNFWANYYAKIKLVTAAMKMVASSIASAVNQSNQYIENVNLFHASMGQYTEEAEAYAEQVGKVMGIDPGAWMRNQGVFNTIVTGFGVASDKAYLMSKNLTQLGYDISSFFNISVDDAMKKLSSGISGELEPLRRLGYDLSVARLEEEALALGITKKVSKMTQAEKAMLRYHAIMTQVTTAQGDMARTLDTPANQIRILKAQVEQCARAFGNTFIPILNKILPYCIAVANAIRMIAQAFAELMGFTMPEVDYSGLTGAAVAADELDDGLDSSTKKAKKLNELLADWDELNIIASESGGNSSGKTGSGSDAAGGGWTDFELPEYDFLGNLIGSKADEILTAWKPTINWIITNIDTIKDAALAVGAALVVWEIGKDFQLGLGKTALLAVGLMLAISGITEAYRGFTDQWNNGVTFKNMIQVSVGVIAGMSGILMVLKGLGVPIGTVAWGIGLIAAGFLLIINPMKEFIETGKMTDEMLGQISVGILAIGAGIALLVGGWIPIVVAAVIVAAAWIVQKWDDIKQGFIDAWLIVSDWWTTTIQPAIDTAVTWIDTNLIQPVSEFFSGLWKSIMGEEDNRTPIGVWWDTLWNTTILGTVETINTKIVQPIIEFFTALWGSITGDENNNLGIWWDTFWNQTILGTVNDINTNIVQPIIEFFTALWGTITGDEENNMGIWWNDFWNTTILGTVNDINTNIVQPIIGFFTDLWNSFADSDLVQGAISWFINLWARGKGFAENIGSIVTNITGKISGFFRDLWYSIEHTTAVQGAIAWFKGLWEQGKGFAQNVADVATNITDKIAGFFTGLWDSFTDSPLVTGAVAWWNNLWGSEGSIATGASDFATNTITPMIENIASIWDNFKESEAVQTAMTWWNGLWGADGTLAKGVALVNENVLTPIGTFFTDVWGNFVDTAVGQAAVSWWNGLWGADGTLAAGFNAVNEAVLTPVGTFFTEVWDNFKETESGKAAVEWWNSFWGEGGTFQSALSTVDANVIQPIAGFFTDIWGNFTESDLYSSAVTFWDGLWAENGVFSHFPGIKSSIETIEGFFTGLWGTIKGDEQNNIATWWTNLWSEDGIFAKLPTNLSTTLETVGGFFSSLWGTIRGDENNNIATWWTDLWGEAGPFCSVPLIEETFSTIGGFFTSLWGTITGDENNNILTWWNNLWGEEGFLGVVNDISTKITEPISGAFEAAATAVESAWTTVKNFFIGVLNSMIGAVNTAIGFLNTMNFTVGPFNLWDPIKVDLPFGLGFTIPAVGIPAVTLGISGIPTIPLIPVETKAEGGFIDQGQMFIAREQGAELVGQIGNRTAVANNEQIEEGIASGVRDANQETNDILRELYAVARQISLKKFSLEPSTTLARTVKRSEEMRMVAEGV